MNFHDVELLSAYLDGQLSPSDSARLESRLAGDANLRRVMDDLKGARGLLRQLPKRRAPRDFTLHPTMKNLEAPVPRAYSALRLAAALASFLFLTTLAVNGLVPLAASRLAAAPAAAPAYGMGGGGGGPEELATAPALTEVPPPSDQLLPSAKAVPQTEATRGQNAPPIPTIWEWIFLLVAMSCVWLARLVRQYSKRNFRSHWTEK